MNRKMFTITLMALLALLLSVGGVTSQGPAPGEETQPQGEVSIAATVNSRISFQGRLMEDGTPVTGDRDMTFRLYSEETCSTQVGDDIVRPGVPVEDGLFSVKLDVSHWDFDGQGLWLEVEVDGTAIGCQEVLPVPYALSLRPGARINDPDSVILLNRLRYQPPTWAEHKYGIEAEVDGSFHYAYGVYGAANNQGGVAAYGLYGSATANGGTAYGVYGQSETDSDAARGVYGTAPYVGVEGHATATSGKTSGVYGQSDSSSDNATGVRGYASASSGKTYGVHGRTDSSTSGAAGVYGYASAISGPTNGVHGEAVSASGRGVYGAAPNIGLLGHATATSGETHGVFGRSYSPAGEGVYGTAPKYGVRGVATASSGSSYGVWGESDSGTGVYASSDSGVGLHSISISNTAVYASSDNGVGVHAVSNSDTAVWAQTTSGIAAVDARNTTGTGVSAHSDSGVGVHSISISNTAVYAGSDSGVGVHAVSNSDTAVWAQTTSGIAGVDARNTGGGHGVYAESAGPGEGGAALYARANGTDGIALWGNSDSTDSTLVLRNDGTGDLIRAFSHGDWDFRFRVDNDGRTTVSVLAITGGSDLSEQFDVTAANGEVTPGMVVCIDADHPGRLLVCNKAYDRTVAGVVSGAGGIEPGMVMGQQGSPADGAYPVALTGRVYVWADASAGPIQPGDLLTTSDTPGHVMRVSDHAQAQGAIIGKAMSTLAEGRGLALMLVSLQ
jgi:hypothetical protein